MAKEIRVGVLKIGADILLLLLVGLPILFLFLFGSAFQRGFYCDDESLRHPYHDSTVPSIYLYIFGLGMNSVIMIFLEWKRPENRYDVVVMGKRVPAWIWNAWLVLLVFAFGACCSQLTTDIMKYTIGRLRPHFYTLCMPQFGGKTCEGNIGHDYITNFTCTNKEVLGNKRKMKEMRLSFPSGHSSFSMYTMLYFAIYLHCRLKCNKSKLFKHVLQFIAIVAAVYTGMTRVSDYKHHWSDVLAGFFIGALVAIIVTVVVGRLFKNTQNRRSYIEIPSSSSACDESHTLIRQC